LGDAARRDDSFLIFAPKEPPLYDCFDSST
jgi:hypothetical protein